MSAAKAKGTAAETAVATWLRDNGFPYAERRALAGIADKGDLTGIPGLCVEVKAHARLAIPEWLRELDAEVANSAAAVGLLVVKPKGIGVTRVGDWWAVQRLSSAAGLLREAGWSGDA